MNQQNKRHEYKGLIIICLEANLCPKKRGSAASVLVKKCPARVGNVELLFLAVLISSTSLEVPEQLTYCL